MFVLETELNVENEGQRLDRVVEPDCAAGAIGTSPRTTGSTVGIRSVGLTVPESTPVASAANAHSPWPVGNRFVVVKGGSISSVRSPRSKVIAKTVEPPTGRPASSDFLRRSVMVRPMHHRTRRRIGLFALGLAFGACAQDDPSTEVVQPGALAALLASPDAPLLLDVRTPEEFAAGHVSGATLVPIQELPARLGELAAYEERGVVAYCEVGGRAGKAAELLRAHGFAHVRLLDGSMRRWREEQREVATGAKAAESEGGQSE